MEHITFMLVTPRFLFGLVFTGVNDPAGEALVGREPAANHTDHCERGT